MIANTFDKPMVSIIVPNYNNASIISETLDSVAKQTYSNWECIIVDDGSTDDSENIIKDCCEKDTRFKYYKRSRNPKGAPTCRNIGLEKSMGEYLIFIDSDDILSKTCLEIRLKTIQDYPDYDFWVFQTGHFYKYLGDSDLKWNTLFQTDNESDLIRFLNQDNPWPTPGPIWEKSKFLKLNGWDENAFCWQDWEVHIRAICSGLRYWKDPEEIADTFYRREVSFGKNNIDLLRLKYESIISLLERLHAQINEYQYFNKEINLAITKLYVRLLNELLSLPFYKLARKLILRPSARRQFSKPEWITVLLLAFKLYPIALNRLKDTLIRKVLTRFKPEKFNIRYSSTYIFQTMKNKTNH